MRSNVPHNSSDPFNNALAQLDRAASVSPLSAALRARLAAPEREVVAALPVRMDNGTERMFEAYRTQYNSLLGPYKGGIRYHPGANQSEVRALAFWMTIKTALANLPLGGGKGGIAVDPKTLSRAELERLSRGWVRALYPVLGPTVDIPAPDVGTTPQVMVWMQDEYTKCTGDTSGATFTGKPVEYGGSEGRTEATALGGWYALEALQGNLQLPANATVAIQGMGNVGGHAAEIFAEHGYKVVATSNSKGGTYTGEGEPRSITNAELLELPVDILVPAALENQITKDNAHNIKATVVLELANGPTTPEADDILHERGVVVVPDILANSGGVVVSYLEWEQNRRGERWSKDTVLAKLKELVERETSGVWERAQVLNTDLRRAAFVIALEKLERALRESNPQ